MKSRYAGRHMTIYGYVLPGAISIARSAFLAGNLSERAKQRLKILDWHKSHGKNISLTARHFGITRYTVLRIYSSLSSKNGADFLQECINNFDFEIKNIQTDYGPEFLGQFDKLCKQLKIPHYFI